MEKPSDFIPSVPSPADAAEAAALIPDFDEAGSKLSRTLVDFYKDIYGRGPVTVRTLFAPQVAVTVLHTVLTPAEQTLVAGGKLTEVEQMRLRTAEVVRPRLIVLAEEALGEGVAASVTGIGLQEDVATETFFLVPDPALAP
jgi:uncharacterized protein YbcI